MMQFAITVKLQLNMHDLNNERAEEIRRVPLVYRVKGSYKFVEEAVAISGVMLKRYHFANMVDYLMNSGGKLCPFCSRKEAIRLPSRNVVKDIPKYLGLSPQDIRPYLDLINNPSEDKIISSCAGEDVHGFLLPQPPLRRESLVKFSWMLPIWIDELEEVGTPTPFTVVQHTRNLREMPEELSDEFKRLQMPYPRGYGNGVFGFVSIADLGNIGHSFCSNKDVLESEERARRQIATIKAYAPMLSGLVGASLARALPACKIMEVMGIAVKGASMSIPAPSHPIYEDYFDATIGLYNSYAKLFDIEAKAFVYGLRAQKTPDKLEIEEVSEPIDVINKAIKFLGLSG